MGSWLGEYVNALMGTVGCGLAVDSSCAAQHLAQFAWAVPVGVGVVAGISLMVGQWALLAINRVGRWRTLLTLVASGLGTLLAAAIEAALVTGLGWLLLGGSPRIGAVLPSVLIAFAPYWLGFLVVLPYTGPGVARIVKVWHLLLLWQLLRPALGVGSTAALAVAAAAWLAAEVIDVAIERSPIRLRERVFCLASGSPGLTGRDLMASAKMGEPR